MKKFELKSEKNYVVMSVNGDMGEMEYEVDFINEELEEVILNGIEEGEFEVYENVGGWMVGVDNSNFFIFEIEKGKGYEYYFDGENNIEKFEEVDGVEEGIKDNREDVFSVEDIIKWSVKLV